MEPHIDVIVVGAGLSGLTAAHELQKRGISTVVLEARGRVGGKTWSVDPLKDNKPVDVGAAWINDTTQSEVYALAKELGLELVVQNTTGKVVQEDIDGGLSTFEYGGAPAADALSEQDGVAEMLRIRQLFEDTCQQIDIYNVGGDGGGGGANGIDARLDAMTLQEWVESNSKSKTALASAAVWTRAMLGLEPSEVSALYFLSYCKSGGGLLQMRKDTKDGGQYLRFVKGTQALSHGLASRLKPHTLHLSCPVASITQPDPGPDAESTTNTDTDTNLITVTTRTNPPQTFKATSLILTLPTPLYQSISFTPPLPTPKLELSKRTLVGYTNKIILRYVTPFWRRAGLCGLLQSFKGPITVTRDSSVDSVGQYSLTCFLVGAFGRALSERSQAQRIEAVVEHVDRVFARFCGDGEGKVERPLAVAEYEWSRDEFSRGCPVPVCPPGVMGEYGGELRRAFGRVFFAGTETSWVWKGYMEGAVRSGKRVVGELTDWQWGTGRRRSRL
ncbi:hypothetical protein LTR70_008893 [Exophiala xenobiotica]|uniref:Amine oxidase n=1 Tax=Lithohypha guttulata TaxID=1690604 RepID=A0ABR0JZU3_9EURO|nr:hypothetical protein LTR24_008590 [Lithohypha guttulata]KAK5311300.1 hypothetical protein LTR70_008893 [Exophiala xenobiotica]